MSPVDTAPAMTEQQLLDAVLDLCQLLQLRVMHIRPAKLGDRWLTAVNTAGIGYPDLTIAGPGGIAYRELKTDTGRLTVEQDAWIDTLVRGGADIRVWRPRNWRAGDITRELRALAKRTQVA